MFHHNVVACSSNEMPVKPRTDEQLFHAVLPVCTYQPVFLAARPDEYFLLVVLVENLAPRLFKIEP